MPPRGFCEFLLLYPSSSSFPSSSLLSAPLWEGGGEGGGGGGVPLHIPLSTQRTHPSKPKSKPLLPDYQTPKANPHPPSFQKRPPKAKPRRPRRRAQPRLGGPGRRGRPGVRQGRVGAGDREGFRLGAFGWVRSG